MASWTRFSERASLNVSRNSSRLIPTTGSIKISEAGAFASEVLLAEGSSAGAGMEFVGEGAGKFEGETTGEGEKSADAEGTAEPAASAVFASFSNDCEFAVGVGDGE